MINRRFAYARTLGFIIAVALLCLCLPVGSLAAGDVWRGEYFDNRTLAGAPVLVRDDAAIAFDWGYGSPDSAVPNNKFSARWTRTLDFAAGSYRFNAGTDDGIRVYVDGIRVINAWYDQDLPNKHSGEVALSGGAHTIVVEYYEYKGVASAHVWWELLTKATGWIGSYYANAGLDKAPALVREDAAINFDWGAGPPAPGMPSDYFSVGWLRLMNFAPGYYRFNVWASGGVRVLLSGQRVMDYWEPEENAYHALNGVFLNGTRELQVLYTARSGRASIRFTIEPTGKALPNPSGDASLAPAWQVPVSCVSGPLELEAWPLDVVKYLDGFNATVYAGARGGDCSYTYSWEGRVVGGPTHESLTFELHTTTMTAMLGKLTVMSGGQTATRYLYIRPPED